MSVGRDRFAMLCALLLLVAAGCRQQPLPVEPEASLGEVTAAGNRPVQTLGPDDALPAVAGQAPPAVVVTPAPDPAAPPDEPADHDEPPDEPAAD